jgi:hypothetical protein
MHQSNHEVSGSTFGQTWAKLAARKHGDTFTAFRSTSQEQGLRADVE